MKRVLIIINTAFVEFGGLTTVVMNYFRFMEKKGLRIDIASTNHAEKKLVKEVKDAGGRYYCLGPRKNLPKYIMNLSRLIRKKKYDIVHVHGNSATATLELLTAKLCGAPKRIIHIHNSTCSHMTMHKLLMPVFTRCYTDAVACSEKAASWIFKPGTYQVMNNAIDTERFSFSSVSREKLRKQYGIEGKFVIIHVGKINEQKNHTFLLRVFAAVNKIIPDSHLICVGDGPLREQIENEIASLGLSDKVTITGMQSNVHEHLSMGDCFLFPSLWEGLPLSLVEAQSSGIRCITSNNVTKEANVTGRVIYLNLNDSIEKWVKAVKDAYDYDREKEAAENVELIIKNKFDIRKNAEGLRKLYLS